MQSSWQDGFCINDEPAGNLHLTTLYIHNLERATVLMWKVEFRLSSHNDEETLHFKFYSLKMRNGFLIINSHTAYDITRPPPILRLPGENTKKKQF